MNNFYNRFFIKSIFGYIFLKTWKIQIHLKNGFRINSYKRLYCIIDSFFTIGFLFYNWFPFSQSIPFFTIDSLFQSIFFFCFPFLQLIIFLFNRLFSFQNRFIYFKSNFYHRWYIFEIKKEIYMPLK